jgi:hypothetical protein
VLDDLGKFLRLHVVPVVEAAGRRGKDQNARVTKDEDGVEVPSITVGVAEGSDEEEQEESGSSNEWSLRSSESAAATSAEDEM